MAKVATITADFRAEASQFLSELKKVNDQSKRTADTIGRELSGALKTMAGILSVGAFAAFVKSSAQAVDQLGKTSDRLGIATEKLQALRLAAAGAGVSVEVMDKALQESQKRLATAFATGKGDAAEWIARLNLSVSELRRQSPDQLFATYADAISKLANNGDRLAATQALMGKGTETLLNLMRGGSGTIQQAAKDIEDLGLKLTRVDAAQVEAANDSLERMKFIASGVGQQIAVAVSPYVQEFANRLIDAGKQGDGLRTRIESFTKAAYVGFGIAKNAVLAFDAAVASAAFAVAKAYTTTAKFFDTGDSFLGRFGKRIDEFFGLGKQNEALFGKVGESIGFMESFADEAASRVTNALEGIRSFGQLGAEADAIVASARARAEEAAAQAAAANSGTTNIEGEKSDFAKNLGKAMAETQALSLQLMNDIANDRFQIVEDSLSQSLALEAEAIEQRVALEADAQRRIIAQREATTSYTIGLFQALGQKNKIFALAALAIEKVTTIQRILSANAIAAELAFASQLIPGDPTSLARAGAAKAAVLASGRVQAALVAATGAIQAANLFSSGGNAAGSVTNPLNVSNAQSSVTAAAGAQSGRVINVHFNGPISGPDAARWLVEQLRGLINDTDTILISGNSAQAAVIRGD